MEEYRVCVASLEALGRVQQNQKMHVNDDGQLFVDDRMWGTSLRRAFSADSRRRTVAAIKAVVNHTLEHMEREKQIVVEIESLQKASPAIAADGARRRQKLTALEESYGLAAQGIQNLRVSTYAGDDCTRTELNSIHVAMLQGLTGAVGASGTRPATPSPPG
jgi:hypothetical protein